MSTIPALVEAKAIEQVDGRLRGNQSKVRVLYALPEASEEFNQLVAESDDPSWLQKQIVGVFNAFIAGRYINHSAPLPSIKHMKSAIWELKTPSLRIFDFFHCKDVFVIVKITLKNYLRSPSIYDLAIERSLERLSGLPLDEPKHLTTTSISDVLSNQPD